MVMYVTGALDYVVDSDGYHDNSNLREQMSTLESNVYLHYITPCNYLDQPAEHPRPHSGTCCPINRIGK